MIQNYTVAMDHPVFCCFFTQDVFGDLWWWEEEGRRQAVDHLGADLIWDLVLETVLLGTSNCISSVFLLYFLCIPAVCIRGCIAPPYIVACFGLFYCALTRLGFHTPVNQAMMMMIRSTINCIANI